jgi:beta-glucosidase/6-phospho-beta-glucosidase/beta-galactosidase
MHSGRFFALGDFLRFVASEYGRPRILVTENGVCDGCEPVNGKVDDVRAYYVWSLPDNLERAFGDSKRFGSVWTGFATQARIPRASAAFFSHVIRDNGFEV